MLIRVTIIGQGIGMALRGLKSLKFSTWTIYYIVFILYDDLATLSYRTKGRQLGSLIIRTRGHRLEVYGIQISNGRFDSFDRGVHLLVPRNKTQVSWILQYLTQSESTCSYS